MTRKDNSELEAAQALGAELKNIRGLKGLTRHAVAKPAKISAAYLQKLEEGAVRNPSPRILYRLGEVLGAPYGALMELAGYANPAGGAGAVVTGSGGKAGEPPASPSVMRGVLEAEELTEDELRAVAAFVTYLKALRVQGV